MFEGVSADMRTGKFLLGLMGAERRVSCAQTQETGPPSALAEIVSVFTKSAFCFNIVLLFICYTLHALQNITLH